MNKIASHIYKNLKPKQRIIASIEAAARGDESERIRLITSCPKKTYVQTDLEFSESMEKLMVLAMAIEADLRGYALSFFVGLRVDPKNACKFLQDYSDIRAAWNSTVSEMGINSDSMQKAGPPPSPIFELIEDLIPKPKKKKSEKLAAEMSVILG